MIFTRESVWSTRSLVKIHNSHTHSLSPTLFILFPQRKVLCLKMYLPFVKLCPVTWRKIKSKQDKICLTTTFCHFKACSKFIFTLCLSLLLFTFDKLSLLACNVVTRRLKMSKKACLTKSINASHICSNAPNKFCWVNSRKHRDKLGC